MHAVIFPPCALYKLELVLQTEGKNYSKCSFETEKMWNIVSEKYKGLGKCLHSYC